MLPKTNSKLSVIRRMDLPCTILEQALYIYEEATSDVIARTKETFRLQYRIVETEYISLTTPSWM
jgi:hypothetical protein